MSSEVLNPSSMASPVMTQILDQPLREKPNSVTSLPWTGARPAESISSCFELFGEIEFTERRHMPTIATAEDEDVDAVQRTSEDGSSDDSGLEGRKEFEIQEQRSAWGSHTMDNSDARTTTMGSRGGFPPSISTVGRDGKPWLYLKPHRRDGRFLLQVAVVPSHKCLQATRENGRLLLHLSNSNRQRFAQPR